MWGLLIYAAIAWGALTGGLWLVLLVITLVQRLGFLHPSESRPLVPAATERPPRPAAPRNVRRDAARALSR